MISGKWLVLDELNKYIFLKSWGQRFPKDTHDQMVALKKKMKLIELYICIFFLTFFTFLLISHKYKQVETHRSTSCYLYFLKQQNSNTFMNADLFRLILVLIHPQLPGEYLKKTATASGRGVFPSTSIFVNITLWFPMLDHNQRFFCKAAVNFILKLYFEPNIFFFHRDVCKTVTLLSIWYSHCCSSYTPPPGGCASNFDNHYPKST